MSNDKFKNAILIVLAICLIGITVAYATLSQNLNINGVAKVSKYTFYKCINTKSRRLCRRR